MIHELLLNTKIEDLQFHETIGSTQTGKGEISRMRLAKHQTLPSLPPLAVRQVSKWKLVRARTIAKYKAEIHMLNVLKHPFITS